MDDLNLAEFYESRKLAQFIQDPNSHYDGAPGGYTKFNRLEGAVECASSKQKRAFTTSLKGLQDYFAELSPEKFLHVHTLIESLDTTPYAVEVAHHYHLHLNIPALQGNTNIRKRGSVLHIIAEYGKTLHPNMLDEETEVCEHYPWMWIDAMTHLDFNRARECILKQPASDKNRKAILSRLAYWRDTQGEESAADLIKSLHAQFPAYKTYLQRYVTRHRLNIKFE